jgi:hypothetical protein
LYHVRLLSDHNSQERLIDAEAASSMIHTLLPIWKKETKCPPWHTTRAGDLKRSSSPEIVFAPGLN